MQIIKYPAREDWDAILQRPVLDNSSLKQQVRRVLDDVKGFGDNAINKYTKQFDGVDLEEFAVTKEEIDEAIGLLSAELREAIKVAAHNIMTFHGEQLSKIRIVETMPGVKCWRKSVGIDKVGLYIPGGTAPLFSTILMLVTPAVLAGCREIVLCSPPNKEGKLHPAILVSAYITGVSKIYKVGGVQAIAAMAYGTETVPQVYKIFGPGNQYVTCAKQLVQEDGVAIDMPAGPSEVCVLADETAEADFIAADLLSQAEHGTDSQVVLICTSSSLMRDVQEQIAVQLEKLPRKELAAAALKNSKLILVNDINEGVALANAYAAEHLILACRQDEEIADRIVNAGSVFLGNYSPESVGDYASGTNHTLPTNGFARMYSGVSVDSFVKKVTFQKLTQEGLKGLANTVITMAEAEGLEAHANAVRVRL